MKLKKAAGVCGILALTASAALAHDHSPDAPTCAKLTVCAAKKFYTMDPGRPVARAVAECNERILGVGDSLDSLKPWTTAILTTIDQRQANKVVFPGFVDAHQHPLLGAITSNLPMVAVFDTAQAYSPDTKGVKSEAEAFERMRRHLTRQDLDKISTTRPVPVWDASQHHGYGNSAAIAQHKIPNDLKIPGVGRDDKGELNGQFLGVPAASYVIIPMVASKLQPADALKLRRWLVDLNRPGAAGYVDGHQGLWITPRDKLTALMEPWWRDGQQIFARSIGVEAQDVTIATLRRLQARVPRTDHPIGPPKPLMAITLALPRTGQSGARSLGAGQTINLDQALRMVTTEVAYALGIDDKVGSLEPGKLAEFTVLDRDPHDVKAAAIRDIPAWGTVLGGGVFPSAEIGAC